jgi:SAM-dependent methyltransferase
MTILDKARQMVHKQWYQPSSWGMVVNPVFIARRGLFRAIKRLAPRLSGDVLDFGCGSKPYASLFAHARSYLGCDLEVSGHDHQDSQIDCFYDGGRLPFENGRFDAVVSFETFEHVFNLADILAEIYRVTKSSGYLLISIPFAWEEHEVPYDFARYTSFGIRNILREKGYEVVDLEKTTSHVLAVFQLLIAYLHQHVFPVKKPFSLLFRVLFIFPLTALAYFLNALLPKSGKYFCNIVVLARKTGS